MPLSIQECIQKIKEVHPDLYPVWWIEYKGKYIFNMLKRGVNKEDAASNFYGLDPDTGKPTGAIPVMSIMDNPEIENLVDHPHAISPEDQQSVQHDLSLDGIFFTVRFSNNSSLSHYGIRGQRWGERRFQNEDGTLTQEGKERYGEGTSLDKSRPQKMTLKERTRENQAKRADNTLNALQKASTDFIDREKTKKGGATNDVKMDIAWTVLNPTNVVNLAFDAGRAGVAKHKEAAYFKNREKNGEVDPKTGLYLKKEGQYSEKQDLAAVNPSFMDMNENSKNNCMLCTTTYDLRQRGYDVTAQKDSLGYVFSDLKRWYPGAKFESNNRRDANGRALDQKQYMQKTIKNLLKQGDGARGNIMVFWNNFNGGGGHSIFYEVKNGKLIFKDGQTGKTYNNPEKILRRTSVNSYVRLDNLQPDFKRIKAECVR